MADNHGKTWLAVADSTTQFGRAMPENSLIINLDNSNIWILTAKELSTDTIDTSAKTLLGSYLQNFQYALIGA